MSHVLTVPTHFEDLSELSDGFVDRVEQDTLILYGPVPYEDGEEIDFSVLLADGSPALEGKGRVRAAVDGGEERVPETRYDVVVEALELEGRYEVVFESLVMARQGVSEHPEAGDDATSDADSASDSESDSDSESASASESDTESASASDGADDYQNGAHAPSENGAAVHDEPAVHAGSLESELNGDPVDTGSHAVPLSETSADDWAQHEDDDELAETKPGIPVPSAAPPPLDLPEPPHLRVERGPDGLTRPSFANEGAPNADVIDEYKDSWSDPPPEDTGAEEPVQPTPAPPALFNYDSGLPIPAQPPLPGAQPARAADPDPSGDPDHEAPASDYEEVAEDS